MCKRRALSRIEVVVVVLVVLIGTIGGSALMMALQTRLRKNARSAVCLSQLKQLTLAWWMYADQNYDRIVNGMAGKDREEGGVVSEKAWTGRDWADGYEAGAKLPEQSQEQAIIDGTLFEYCRSVNLYHCPSGLPGQTRTYSIVDSMNGVPRPRTQEDNVWINKRSQIRSPIPARRLVFIDVGRAIPESFAVHYDKEQWWASPPVRHTKGTHVSFADGHSDYWEWKASETVKLGKSADSFDINIVPQTPESKEDLHRLQEGVWGKLGYTPVD